MENKHGHLIERAAARLSEARTAPPQSTLLRELPTRVTREIPAAQPSVWESERSEAPVVERAPKIDAATLRKAGLVDDANSRVAEELRIVQNRILRQCFADTGARAVGSANLVMITSALKGEGKSFVSLNLAGEIARHGDRRVLLVDTDAKPGGLSRKLGISSLPGLLDLARDTRLEIDDLIVATDAAGLDALPFGRTNERSGEVFASRRMADVLQQIGRRYADRLVILDAPPCLSSSTPHALASICGQAVLVVAASSTQQADLEAALELLEACPETALLLNKVARWMTHSFGSHSYLAAET